MIQVSHLKKSYPGHLTVFDQLSFSVPAGQTLALCGASGSGKSTLLAMLCGLDIPSSGEIVLNNTHFSQLTTHKKIQFRSKNIGVIFQQAILIPHLSIIENIRLPQLYSHCDISDEWIGQSLKNMQLDGIQNRMPHELSIGQQQRVCVIRALSTSPKIVLADEPTGALDPPNANYIFDMLTTYAQINDAAVMIATHDWILAKKCSNTLWLDKEPADADK